VRPRPCSGPHINGQTDAYLPGESTAFRGHTNEPIPRVVHDVSEILRPNLNRDRDAMGAPTARAAERARAKLAAAERAVLEQAGLVPPLADGASAPGSPRDGDSPRSELDTNTHLRLLFDYYARYGRTGADAVDTGDGGSGSSAAAAAAAAPTLDSANFAKLCRDCPDLLDGERVDGAAVDLAFIRAKAAIAAAAAAAAPAGTAGGAPSGQQQHHHYPSSVRRLTYHGFLDALLSLATAKYPELDAATAFSLLLSQHVFRAPPSAGIAAAFRDGLITLDDGAGSASSVAGGGSFVSPPARRRRPSGSVTGGGGSGSVAGPAGGPAVVLSPSVQARLASAGRPPARAPRRATLAGSGGGSSAADDPLAPPPRPFSAEELAESLAAVPAAAFLTAASARDAIRRLPPDVIAALYGGAAGGGGGGVGVGVGTGGGVPSSAATSVGGATSAANGHGFNDGSVVAGGTPGRSSGRSVDTRTGGLGPFGGGAAAPVAAGASAAAAGGNRSGRSALLSFSPGSAAESSVVGDRLLQSGLNVSADSSDRGGGGGGGSSGSDGGAGDAIPPFDVSAPHTERTDRDDDRDGIARAAAARKISNAEPPAARYSQYQHQHQQHPRHVLPAHLEEFVRASRVAAGVAPPAAAAISPRSVIGSGSSALPGASPRTQHTQRTSPGSRASHGGGSIAAAVVARDAVVAATPPASVYEAIARKTLQLQHGGGETTAGGVGVDHRRGSDGSSFGHVTGGGGGPSRLDASFAALSMSGSAYHGGAGGGGGRLDLGSITGSSSDAAGRAASAAVAAAATPTRHSLATDPSRPQTLSSSAQYYAAVAPVSAARHATQYGAVAAAAAAATRHDLDASGVDGGGEPSTPGHSQSLGAATSARRTPNAAFFRATTGASLGSPSAAGDDGGGFGVGDYDSRSAAGSSVAGLREAPASVIYSPHTAFDETPVGPGASAARFYFSSRGSPTGGGGGGSPGDGSRRARTPSPSGREHPQHAVGSGTVLLRPGAAGAAAFSASLRAGLYDGDGAAASAGGVYSPAATRSGGRGGGHGRGRTTPASAAGGGKPGYGEPGFTPTLAGSGNRRGGVYERLSSPGSFTGVYRRAFESGDGRINGHASTLSAVPHGFRGSTHDKSDVPIGDISAVLRPNLRSALRR
jgi:hypothetical protein